MAIHHLTFKAAVAKYLPLHIGGATEEEVKAEIAKDEKEFDPESVNAIYAAIVNSEGVEGNENNNGELQNPEEGKEIKPVGEKPGKGKAKSYVVVSPFACINNFEKKYSVGEDVSHFSKERLEACIKNKLVEAK